MKSQAVPYFLRCLPGRETHPVFQTELEFLRRILVLLTAETGNPFLCEQLCGGAGNVICNHAQPVSRERTVQVAAPGCPVVTGSYVSEFRVPFLCLMGEAFQT